MEDIAEDIMGVETPQYIVKSLLVDKFMINWAIAKR